MRESSGSRSIIIFLSTAFETFSFSVIPIIKFQGFFKMFATPDIVFFLSLAKPVLPPTYQQVRQTYDTTITFTANHIFEKLCFRVINSSQLTLN
jgi:hypothetical protein